MLEMEETRLKKLHKGTVVHSDNSSSSTALVSTHSEGKPGNQQRNQSRNNRGNKRGGRGRGRYNNNYNRQPYNNLGIPMPLWLGQYNWQNGSQAPWMTYPTPAYNPRAITPQHSNNQQEAHYVDHRQPITDFASAFNTMTLQEPSQNWYMDSWASSHLASSSCMLHSVLNLNTGNAVVVGNSSSIPIKQTGSSFIPSPTRPLKLQNVLVAPKIVKNLVFVRRFTTDNWCIVEFDPFVFSVKDLQTKKTILRSDSSGDLYPVPPSLKSSHQHSVFVAETLRSVISSNSLVCNKESLPFCNACQLGKHLKQHFFTSGNKSLHPFDLIHSDLWTSHVPSLSIK